MASKKTESTKSKAKSAPKKATKAPAKAKAKAPKAPVVAGPRHPRAKLIAAHGSKEALAKKLGDALAHGDQDPGVIADRLKTASNQQLLRLARVTETVKKKWGSRDKLIEAIGAAQKKSKDQDYLARLAAMPLPQLVELARQA